jgi:hypothetical protein
MELSWWMFQPWSQKAAQQLGWQKPTNNQAPKQAYEWNPFQLHNTADVAQLVSASDFYVQR